MSGSTAGAPVGVAQTIAFDEIAYDIRRPQTVIEVAARYSNLGLVDFPAKILAVGLKYDIAAGRPGVAYEITRDGQAEALFGAGSMLAEMVNAIRLVNTTTPLFAMGATPPTGATAATNAVTFQGAAEGAATVPYYLNDTYVPLIVFNGMTAAQQAATFAANINAIASLPVTAAVAGATATLTVKQPGAHGNSYTLRPNLRGDELPPVGGVAVSATGFTGGAGTPDMVGLLSGIATTWFTDLVSGFNDPVSIAALEVEADRRYAANGHLDMHVYYAASLSVGQQLLDGPTHNSRFISRIGAVSVSMPWKWAGVLGGLCAFQLTNDPARQLRSLALPGLVAPLLVDRPLPEEEEQLLRNGWSTFEVLSDGSVVLQRVITCYQQSSLGIRDDAWLDIMRPKVMTRIRYDWSSYLGLVWPRAKLADDDSIAALYDPTIATCKRLQNSWAGRCNLYARLGWIEHTADTAAQSVFVRDPSDRNRVNSRLVVDQIGNLMVFAGRLEFLV